MLSVPARVRATVTDALGREVAVLHDSELSGSAELRADTARLAAGIYAAGAGSLAETRRLTVVRWPNPFPGAPPRAPTPLFSLLT